MADVVEREDRLAGAREQGQAQFESIREMLTVDWEAAARAEGWTLSALPGHAGEFVDYDGNYYDGSADRGDWAELCEYEHIEESEQAREERLQAIQDDPLSVSVRSGWYSPGAREDAAPEEFEILLCVGGPACRLIGSLGTHCEPLDVRIEVQDWSTPWTDYLPVDRDGKVVSGWRDTLLEYARQFYFGD